MNTAEQRAQRAEQARRRRRLKAYGRWTPPTVDAAGAREHAAALARTHTPAGIARLAGLSPATVRRLLAAPDGARVAARTATAILAINPAVDYSALPGTARVYPAGTIRRLQALAAAGWTVQALTRATRLRRDVVLDLLAGYRDRWVLARTANAVSRAYDLLWQVKPTRVCPAADVEQAQHDAAEHGWAGVLAWDDDTIDDPAARPDFGEPENGPARLHAVLEDAAWLTWAGYSPHETARRLGVAVDTLDRYRLRAGARDLVAA